MIQLYIEDTLVDKTEKIDFPLNYTYENLNSPTDIIVTWSKSIKIPFSEKNDALFGRIFLPERLTVDSDTENIGIYFNPHKKAKFKLVDGEILLMSGYVKLSEINSTAKTYTINLTGESANILTELLKYNYKGVDQEYQLNDILEEAFRKTVPSQYQLNAEKVKKSWEHPYDYNTSLDNPYDIYGFALTYQGLYENFKSDKFLYKDSGDNSDKVQSFDNFLEKNGKNFRVGSLTEHQFEQYRSYHQKPFIMVNKLFQHLQQKAQDLGYSMFLHPAWFNINNPYYTKLAVVMGDLVTANKEESTDKIMGTLDWGLIDQVYIDRSNYITNLNNKFEDCVFGVNQEVTITASLSNTLLNNRTVLIDLPALFLTTQYELGDYTYLIRPYVEFQVTVYDQNNNPLDIKNFKYSVEDRVGYTTLSTPVSSSNTRYFFYNGVRTDLIRYSFNTYKVSPLTFTNSSGVNINQIKIKIEVLERADKQLTVFSNQRFENIFEAKQRDYISASQYQPIVRSGVRMSMKLLWNINKTPMQILLDYCKMLNLNIIIDEISQSIIFIPKSIYFNNPEILDWSDKLDKSKDFIINSHIFDSKFMRLGYKENNSELIKQYKEETGNEYGDIILTTPYEFNDKTNTLQNNIENFIESNRPFIKWDSYKTYEGDTLPSETNYQYFLFDQQNSNNKSGNLQGQFAFIIEVTGGDGFYITDDETWEVDNKQFMYHDLSDYQSSYLHTTVAKTLSNNIEFNDQIYGLKFNLPERVYYSLTNYDNFLPKWIDDPSSQLYERIWKDYITERYNRNNKKVTCYLHITNDDIAEFSFNKFIVIDGVLYFMNKIIDYNPNNDETTKVELLTVQDMSKYASETTFGSPSISLYKGFVLQNPQLGVLLGDTNFTALGWGNLQWVSGVNILSNNNYLIRGSVTTTPSTTRSLNQIEIQDTDNEVTNTYTYYNPLIFKPHLLSDGTSTLSTPIDKIQVTPNVFQPSYNNGVYIISQRDPVNLIVDAAWETTISTPNGEVDEDGYLVIRDSQNIAIFYAKTFTTTDAIPQTRIYIEYSPYAGLSEELELILHSPYSEDVTVKLQKGTFII